MKQIDKLTDEQRAMMKPHAEEWVKIGFCTDEADWDTFEKAAEKCYTLVDLEWPGVVVRVTSPLIGAIAAPIAAAIIGFHQSNPQNGALTHESIEVCLDTVDLGELKQLLPAVKDTVRASLVGCVAGTTHSGREIVKGLKATKSKAKTAIPTPALWKEAVRSLWYRYMRGSMSASSLAWQTFFVKIGLELEGNLEERLDAHADTVRSAFWWWPYRDFVIVCDRPKVINLEQIDDTRKQLHNDEGPSIEWRDGWSLWHVHGVAVDEQIVLRPETLTVEQIMANSNAEVRRVMCERLGWEKFIQMSGATLVDEAPDPANAPYSLRLFDLNVQPFADPVRLMLCVNASPEPDGTRREFGITVPMEVNSALAASAWTFGLSADEYAGLASAS